MENTSAAVCPTASFFCREGSSDKEYHMQVVAVEGGFQVNYQYGRRGSTLTPGVKPAKPVPIEKAVKQFESMCKERLGKGYTAAASSGTPAIEAVAREKSGLMPQLLNTVDESDLDPLFHDDTVCMQEKKDGERVMTRRHGNAVTASNKLGITRPLPQAVVDAILSLPCTETVLDGELIGDTYHVFDLLSLDGNCQRNHGYVGRYASYIAFLSTVSHPAIKAGAAWFSEEEKRAHFARIKAASGEGVVFKDINAPYSPGRPNSGGTQLKFKFTESATCIVDRISDARRSVSLALLDERGEMIGVGSVTIPVNHGIPVEGDLVEVRYLYRYENGSLFQPVFLGQRQDIAFEECTLKQIRRIKAKSSSVSDEE